MPEYANLLPEAIRPFFVEDERKRLPFRKENTQVYNRLSKLVLATGGHPRRVFRLFEELSKFNPLSDQSYGQSEMSFAESLGSWLSDERENDILRFIDNGTEFPTEFDLGPDESVVIEQIAVDTAREFSMPGDARQAENHKYTLLGTTTGHCSFVDSSGGKLLAFIPPPVLAAVKRAKIYTSLKPCGLALWELACGIENFHSFPISEEKQENEKKEEQKKEGEPGQVWERVVAVALLLFVRSNSVFSPSIFCNTDLCGDNLKNTYLKGGETVEFWENIKSFPDDEGSLPGNRKVTANELRCLSVASQSRVVALYSFRNPSTI